MQAGEWWHSIDHDEPCRVVDTDTLWGQATCLVWLPRRGHGRPGSAEASRPAEGG